MTSLKILKQKQLGLALVAIGGFSLGLILLAFALRAEPIEGFPEFLPAKETGLYAEFPGEPDELIIARLRQFIPLDWKKDIEPLAPQKAGFALVKNEKSENGFSPLLFLKMAKNEEASAAATTLAPKYPAKASGNIVLLGLIPKEISGEALGSDPIFILRRQAANDPYFIYAKPAFIPDGLFDLPKFTPELSSLSIASQKTADFWQGKALLELQKKSAPNDHAYRALLLPFLPEDIDLFLGGQNLQNQWEELQLRPLFFSFAKQYLPGVDFEKEVAPLFQGEFAAAIRNSKGIFITESSHPDSRMAQEKLRTAFQKAAPKLSPTASKITLPDGTSAEELVPDASSVKVFEEDFHGLRIRGILFGKEEGIYDAVSQQKWFVSNDLTMLKKALLLTKEPGRSFRESTVYKENLRPILKNPEFLGVAMLPGGTLSFSKRTFADRMEIEFKLLNL